MLIGVAIAFTACGDDDDSAQKLPSLTGTMTDLDGNTYTWVRIGNQDWMAQNLNSGDPYWDYPYYNKWGDPLIDVDNQNEADSNLVKYGNLYTYEDALKNAPEGWRLPSDDDWKHLERALGMSAKNADKFGWRDGAGTLMTSAEGLHLLFGGKLFAGSQDYGGRVSVHYVGDEGCYWTSTADSTTDEPAAYFRKVMPNLNRVQRFTSPTEHVWMSVRYVRDAK